MGRTSASAARRARVLLLGAALAFAAHPDTATSQPAAPGAPAPAAPAAAPAPAPPAPPPSIPVPEIASRAEETVSLLRAMQQETTADTQIATLADRLPELDADVQNRVRFTSNTLEEGPRLTALDSLTRRWVDVRAELTAANDLLTRRAVELEQQIDDLAQRRELWERTQSEAAASQAPDATLDRVRQTLQAIRDARKALDSRRAGVLALQDAATRQLASCDAALAQIKTTRDALLVGLSERDSRPLWDVRLQSKDVAGVRARLVDAFASEALELRPYFSQRLGSLALILAVFVGSGLVLRSARARADRWEATEVEAATKVFDVPWSSALLLASIVSAWTLPGAPSLYTQALGVVALFAALRLTRELLPARLHRTRWAVGISFLLDRVRGLLAPVPVVEQGLFALQLAGLVALLAWLLYQRRRTELELRDHRTGRLRLEGLAWRLTMLLLAIGFAAAVSGHMRLALLVGGGALFAVYLAVVFFAGISVLRGFAAFLLHVRPLGALHMVKSHRSTIEARLGRAVTIAGYGGWLFATLRQLQLLDPARAVIRAVLDQQLAPGDLDISIGDVCAFGITVWVAFRVARFLRFVLEEDVYPRLELARGVPYAASSLVQYGVIFAGFVLALGAMGVDMNRITVLSGAFAVGIGFGLQNIVNNFVSGLILLFERPVNVGDAVQLGDVTGEVTRIGIRSSTVRTWEGAEVIVPNAMLIQDRVTNWTHSDRMRRIDIAIGVDYAADPQRVLELLVGVAKADDRVIEAPPPIALFVGFGASSLDFQLRLWTDRPDWPVIRSDLAIQIHRALGEAGISIPFPQQDVHLTVERK